MAQKQKRLTITPKDVQEIYGMKSYEGARNKLNAIKEDMGKTQEQAITVQQFADHEKIPVTEVKDFLNLQ